MRKHIVMTAVIMLFVLLPSNGGLAARYPSHINGDKNYVLIAGKQGLAWYIDRASIGSLPSENEGILYFDICTVDANYEPMEIKNVSSLEIHYKLQNNTPCMYIATENGLRYLEPLGSWAVTGKAMPAGEMAYYLFTGKRFYGQGKWSNNKFSNVEVFGDSFYKNAE